jgi:hypothetical protein
MPAPLTVARAVRRRGVSLEQAEQIRQYLWNMPPEHLEAHFRQGQTCLLLAGTAVLPKLLTLESILAIEQMDDATAASAGMRPTPVDVQRMWQWIQAHAGPEEPAEADSQAHEVIP